MRELFLWLREDGEAPKLLGERQRPPGPGKVLGIQARNKADAIRLLRALETLRGMFGGTLTADVVRVLAARDPNDARALQAVREVPPEELDRGYGSTGPARPPAQPPAFHADPDTPPVPPAAVE